MVELPKSRASSFEQLTRSHSITDFIAIGLFYVVPPAVGLWSLKRLLELHQPKKDKGHER